MAKTKQNIIDDLKDSTAGCKTFEQMMEKIAVYIIRNYKLKKITITSTVKTESMIED